MCSEMRKRNIKNELHRFERLKTHTYKINHLTDILQSRMNSCTHTHTHTHTHTTPGVSVVCAQLGRLRLPVSFSRENALTEPFDKLPYFLQIYGRVF